MRSRPNAKTPLVQTGIGAQLQDQLRWQRLVVTLACAGLLGALLSLPSGFPPEIVVGRSVIAGLLALCAFSLAEHWPERLPKFLARWFWQLFWVALCTPVAAFLAYALTTGGDPQFHDKERFQSALVLAVFGTLIALAVALAAMLNRQEALARRQHLALELTRSELARLEAESRWRQLQAQTTPHFLFNTLANVQALLDMGSPQASALLANLVAYLRAAIPHAESGMSTVRRELALSRAYLEIMRTRLPDRLRYEIECAASTEALPCLPLVILTLLENAVRHGIDPNEDAGLIRLTVVADADVLQIHVQNTCADHAGKSTRSLGTGLAVLRERLQINYGARATLQQRWLDNGDFAIQIRVPIE